MGATVDNKVKFNLRNVHIAKVTSEEGGKFTYDTPKPIPGAVSLNADAKTTNEPFYADGMVYYRAVANNGYSGDLEIANVPDWFYEEILNEVKDSKGVLTEVATSNTPKHFALLWEFEGDIKAIRHVAYNVSVERISVTGKTTTDKKAPQTDKLKFVFDPRPDGLVKAKTTADTTMDDTTYQNWYKKVYEKGDL